MADAPVIRCAGLAKTYRDFWGRRAFPALRGIDLEIARGERHALLGPNGSGKTTTLRLLLGLIRPTQGSVEVFGGLPTDPGVRSRIGFLPEDSALHDFLTCRETLELYADLYGVPRAEVAARIGRLLTRVHLVDAAKKRVHTLSKGMKRRLALAVAVVGEPELLVLDEPTSGIDPLAREGVLALLDEHAQRGGTLLVTSHLLGDIKGIATRTTLLAEGRVARTGDLDDLLRLEGVREYRVRAGDDLDAAVRSQAEAQGGEVISSGPARATIEELFLDTYRSAGDGDGDGDTEPTS